MWLSLFLGRENPFNNIMRVKTYLRSCMTQVHLNHFVNVMLHGQKEFTDRLSLIEIARSFVGASNLLG